MNAGQPCHCYRIGHVSALIKRPLVNVPAHQTKSVDRRHAAADQPEAQGLGNVEKFGVTDRRRKPHSERKDARVPLVFQLLDLLQAKAECMGAVGPVEFNCPVPHQAASTQVSSPLDASVTEAVDFSLREPLISNAVRWNAPSQ